MDKCFPYSNNNKRYHTFTHYLTQKFGQKVAKISLNAGFTCPNIDGTKGRGGCTYCSAAGSGDYAGDVSLSLKDQFDQVAEVMQRKWGNVLYLPYFQAFTNTYAPLSVLKSLYEEVLAYPAVVGLSIATRGDCITEEIADYLQELSQKSLVIVELGLQSIFDETGEKINRCHSYDEFLAGYTLLATRNIPICVHIINGLPNETKEMMLETAKTVANLDLHSIKIHLLHVIRGTEMAKQFENGEFPLMTREDYVEVVCSQLEYFKPEVVVQRLTGDGKAEDLIGPLWSLKKLVVMNEIDKEFKRRNTYQGFCVEE